MNERRQYRVLYREFLFRIVDRELLSTQAKGDASQLLLQILTLLLGVSVLFSLPALFSPAAQPQIRLMSAWSAEHFLIATTMLTVGVFAVLGWGSLFPDQRDVLVLSPLPVRPRTIFLAKIGATGTALAATVLALHAVTSVAWPLRLNASPQPYTIPALTSQPASAAVGADGLQDVLDKDFAAALRDGELAPGAGGVSIGVSTHGVRRVLAYGAAAPDSVFEIGSVTKVFTGLALADMIQQGIVRGDEPVRQLIAGAGLPRPPSGTSEITLFDLVTHHSGLPRMPADFRPRDPDNPFADFDVSRLYAFLAAHGVERPADAPFLYSNLGFGLLGHALATRAGVDYATLVRTVITQPLAMTDTTVTLTADQQRRLMQGHDREHLAVKPWDLNVIAGAGALKSTAADQLTFLEANLHPERLTSGLLQRAIAQSHTRLANVGTGGGIAFAWQVGPNGEFAHMGDTAGFSAAVLVTPAMEQTLVVLANTAIGASISADVIAEHIRSRLDGQPPLAIAEVTIPARSGIRSWLRLFAAYWGTMFAAGLFVFAAIVAIQGLATAVLPQRHFLKASSVLQVGVFCALVGAYFLSPMVVTASAVANAQRPGLFGSLPSYWFLGMFQALSGSPALAPLAQQAVIGLAVALVAAAAVCASAYVRTLRRMAEVPDSVPALLTARHLPPFGRGLDTAIGHFSARTLLRSAPHRIIFTFYLGIGFALSAVFLKTPKAQQLAETASGTWDDMAMPFIVSSVLMMVCAVVGARLTFAMPRDLAANWIFRVVPVRGASHYLAARRRALIVFAAGPVWLLSAGVLVSQWPLVPTAGHLLILALLGSILVELCLSGPLRIPFTCAYLPGQSRSHLAVPVIAVTLLLMPVALADFERLALHDASLYSVSIGVLAVIALAARWRTSWMTPDNAEAEFDGEPGDRMLTFELWDSRAPSPASATAIRTRE